MNNNIKAIFQERYDEYLKFRDCGEFFGAISNLSEIHNCIIHGQLDYSLCREWKEKLEGIPLSEEIIRSVKASIDEKYLRIQRIMSIGDIFNDDEFLLILTFRVQIELVVDFLGGKKADINGVDISRLDYEIEEIIESKKNRKAFNSALSQMRKNWGLPITNKWFSS